jgi:hypothetical protein
MKVLVLFEVAHMILRALSMSSWPLRRSRRVDSAIWKLKGGKSGARRVTASPAPRAPQESRWALRGDERRRGSVGFSAAAFGPGLQISYLNSRPQRVQFQTAKSACFTVGAGSKSWSQSASPELARIECEQ